jgi:hypothetical protein
MKQDIKVFERGTLMIALRDCLAEGFVPTNTVTIFKLITKGTIPVAWYNSRTILSPTDGFRDATLAELKNPDKVYEKGGCFMYVWRPVLVGSGYPNWARAYGLNYLAYYLSRPGRLVGVRSVSPKATDKKKRGVCR